MKKIIIFNLLIFFTLKIFSQINLDTATYFFNKKYEKQDIYLNISIENYKNFNPNNYKIMIVCNNNDTSLLKYNNIVKINKIICGKLIVFYKEKMFFTIENVEKYIESVAVEIYIYIQKFNFGNKVIIEYFLADYNQFYKQGFGINPVKITIWNINEINPNTFRH